MENHSAVDRILQGIPRDAKWGPNKIREYNQTFRALEKHGYEEAIETLIDWAIKETRSGEYSHLPSAKHLCRQIVGLTGVDEALEDDLPRNF